MALQFFNSLTRSKEEFVPLDPELVRLYTCGPTVYAFAHIGNFRAYVFEDILRRHLEYRGYKVYHVMNLTDVDDKTIRGAREQNISIDQFTAPFKAAFFEDVATLRLKPADQYPEATRHVPEMIRMIEVLIAKGHAYQADDHSIYFRISSFQEYGKLAHLDRQDLQAGARVSQDEYEKETAADFALWKAWDPQDGDVAWDSPWGRGRPGWHLECSAMSMKYLGETFDIHTGGVDNLFPHHEDEIAQSECTTGKTFVRYWLHCEHLIVDGRKMSKSLGNFFTVRDLVSQGFHGREIRFELLKAHYRQQLNFTTEGLRGARQALARVDQLRHQLKELGAQPTTSSTSHAPSEIADQTQVFLEQFGAALDDDLNTPDALGALFALVRETNKWIDAGRLQANDAQVIWDALSTMDRVLAIQMDASEAAGPPDAVVQLAEARMRARKDRDWAEADTLREQITTAGWIVEDTPSGYRLKPAE
ncbi:MAG: cysteine--tRNA ligase [Verrucomicrobiota bacterium]|nr:cysteine--tRNA ligase [Verrucomicrobiota bacterium]